MKPDMIRAIICLAACLVLMSACSDPEEKKQAFLEKGNTLFEQADYTSARLEYKNAIQIDPKFARGYYRLGLAELRLSNMKKAYGSFMKAVELDPESLDARLDLGKLLLAGRAADRAMEQADAILGRDPGNIEGKLLKASALFSTKDIRAGTDLLLEVYHNGEKSEQVYLMLISTARLGKDKEQERHYLKEGLAAHPDSIGLILATARFEAAENNYTQVADHFAALVALKPEVTRYRLNLAKAYWMLKQPDKVDGVLEDALAAAGDEGKTRMGIAGFWLSLKQIDRAEALILEGIEQDQNNFEYRHFLAGMYTELRLTQDAEAQLRTALELTPDPADPMIIRTRTALGRLMMQTGRIDQGNAQADMILEQDPQNVDAHFLKGRWFLSRKDGINAVSEFRVVVQDRPKRASAHLNLAEAHMLNKDPELAMAVLEKAHNLLPKENTVLQALARMNLYNKDFDAAEKNLLDAVANQPGDLTPRIYLGDFYSGTQAWDKALTQYNIAMDQHPRRHEGYLKAAAVFGSQKKYDQAIETLKAGYKNNPQSAYIVTNLVKGYMSQKSFAKAETLCRERLDKNDKDAFAWNILGNVLMASKKVEQAQNAYETAAGLKPEWGAPYDNLARSYLIRGNRQKAIAKFEQALEKNPKNITAWMVLAGIYNKDKDYDKAAKTYARAFEQNPGLWSAANNFAFIKSEFSSAPEDLEIALSHAQKALALKPGAGVIEDTIGWIHFKMGNLEQAQENISKALAKEPDSPVLNYHMGMLLDRQGKMAEARDYLKKSLEPGTEFPGYVTAKKTLAQYNG